MIKKFGYYQALNMDNLVKMQIWTFYAISEAQFSNICMFIGGFQVFNIIWTKEKERVNCLVSAKYPHSGPWWQGKNFLSLSQIHSVSLEFTVSFLNSLSLSPIHSLFLQFTLSFSNSLSFSKTHNWEIGQFGDVSCYNN